MLKKFLTNWRRILVTTLSVVGLSAGLTGNVLAGNASGISASLSLPESASTGISVDFTLSNNSGASVSLLTWNTPLEGINNDIFHVTRNGKAIDYVGRMVKRGAPKPADYVTLGAGQSKTVHVDLSNAYAFDTAGIYEVSFDSTILDVATSVPTAESAKSRLKSGTAITVTSSAVKIDVKSGLLKKSSLSLPLAEKSTSFNGCTASEQTLLNAARVNAAAYARSARNALKNTAIASRPNAKRSKTWFGKYSSARYNLVISHFSKMYTALSTANYKFDCTCSDDFYAYVFPNQPYNVYLCNAFWAAPAKGTDSKAGTLIHESSHFTVLGGTDDHAYGQTAAKALAKSNPSKAVMNADSHEYFAENTPAISQP